MFIGEIIALTTVVCWTVSVQFFGAASKMVGSIPVNIIRITASLVMFGVLQFVRAGTLIPMDFPLHAWIYLGLSGVIGFFIGDIFLFKALVELGPRVAMLIQSLAAPTAALIGWCFLAENYSLVQWFGILVTLAGVAIVILERNPNGNLQTGSGKTEIPVQGVVYGLLGMLGQAGGFVLSKVGMQVDDGYLDAFPATEVRVIAAFICFIVFISVTGRWRNIGVALRNQRVVAYTVTGAFIGPFVGVSLSLLTLHYLTAGVASTILSLVPVCIIPFSVFLYKERVSLRAVSGAFIAVFGVWMLVW